MKYVFVLMCFLSSMSASADSDGGTSITRVKAFLASKKPCVFAAGKTRGQRASLIVTCVWEGVTGQGTLNEHSGCFFGEYDMGNGKYSAMPGAVSMDGGLRGSCTPEHVAKLLKVPGRRISSYGTDKPSMTSTAESFGDSIQYRVMYNPYGVALPKGVK